MRAPRFWDGKSAGAKVLAPLLSPLAALYGVGPNLSRKRQKSFRPRANVICVGNLTLGGTGKTPIAIALAEALLGREAKAVFLSRGYRGRLAGPVVVDLTQHSAADVGDEPLLLARTATTIISRDRAAGAALADKLGAEIIIMDDGHQNFSLRKDFSLVVVDAKTGFGNGHLFPAGPLREPIGEGLDRADAVILVGKGNLRPARFEGPILAARLEPTKKDAVEGERLIAFSGIGRPEKFFDTLSEMGGLICAARSFPDHHAYSENDIRQLRANADDLEARLVTTEKDFVRIAPHQRENIHALPIRAQFEDANAFEQLLNKLSGEASEAAT